MELVLNHENFSIPKIQEHKDAGEPDLIIDFISDLITNSTGLLSAEQIITGEKISKEFLASHDLSYALINGKSGKILALSQYLSRLPYQEMNAKIDLIFEKICSDKNIILSDAIYNDWEDGRAGMLFAMSHLIILKSNKRIEKIFSSLLQLLIKDARFFKKGIKWMRSDLNHSEKLFADVTAGIHLTLRYINNIFKNDFIKILIDGSNEVKKRNNANQYTFRNPDIKEKENAKNLIEEWAYIFEKMTLCVDNKPIESKIEIILTTEHQGFHDIIFANFREIFSQIPAFHLDVLIPDIIANCQSLNQYEILARMKDARPHTDKYLLRVLLRRLRLRASLIDRSDIFINENKPHSTYYENCIRLAEMSEDDFFNVKLAINETDIQYKILKSNWLYATKYAKKNIIGCFSVKRFDKSVFLHIDILDGFFPKLLMYLLDREANISQFKKDILDDMNLNVNDTHLKNRILLLIRQGIFIPQ